MTDVIRETVTVHIIESHGGSPVETNAEIRSRLGWT